MTDAARRDSTVGGIHNEDNPLVADSALVSTQPHIDADAKAQRRLVALVR